MASLLKEWKDDIRDMLQRVHTQFIQIITDFTKKFYNSLMKIEHQSEKLAPFITEDSRQNTRLESMKEKFQAIDEIIKEIDDTIPNLKASVVRSKEE